MQILKMYKSFLLLVNDDFPSFVKYGTRIGKEGQVFLAFILESALHVPSSPQLIQTKRLSVTQIQKKKFRESKGDGNYCCVS